jgi:hypothetical protein
VSGWFAKEASVGRPTKHTFPNVWLETDHVTLQLQADGPVSASAFGLIHDRRQAAGHEAKVIEHQDFAIFDDEGSVVGTHRIVRLEGARSLNLDDVQERTLARATTLSDRNVDIVTIDLSSIPLDAEFSIDRRTGRPRPARGPHSR